MPTTAGKPKTSLPRKYRPKLTKPPEALQAAKHDSNNEEDEDNDNHEYYTDLTAIYFGFGIFMANTCNQRETWSDNKGYSGWAIGRQGYLPQQMIVYALAVQAYLQGRKDPEWADQLDKIPRKMFKQSLLWLNETQDCDAQLPQAHGGRASDI